MINRTVVFWALIPNFILCAQTVTTLVNFAGANGSEPLGLIQTADGNSYGVTSRGGSGFGTIFSMTAGGKLSTIYTFTGLVGEISFPGINGASPSSLIQGSDGNFYGTTTEGGIATLIPLGGGTIFKITPTGTLTTLYRFDGSNGERPAPLIQATDGNFYGVTTQAGPGHASIFSLTPSGAMTILHSFSNQEGLPYGGLVQAGDGNFYGVAASVGDAGYVYRLTPAGVLTGIANFAAIGVTGAVGTLALGRDGNLYGVTWFGSASSNGTVFRVTTGGVLTLIHSFSSSEGSQPGPLIQASDGNFYGTTALGGAGNFGTVYKITPDGALTVLHDFLDTEGTEPNVLIQGSDGNLYGTTLDGGSYFDGTLFTLTLGGTPAPPSVSLGPVSGISNVRAIVSASISANGAETQAGFVYSTNSSLNQAISTGQANIGSAPGSVPMTLQISGLAANTTYYYRATASNIAGTAVGSVSSFTTAGAASYNISCIVLASGQGLTGVGIIVTSASQQLTPTDSSGKYSLSVPSGGSYIVTPMADGSTFVPPSVSLPDLNADQTLTFTALASTAKSSLTTLVNFGGAGGAQPEGGVIQGSDGNLYGTTTAGGASGSGTVFQITPAGDLTMLHNFAGGDSADPVSRLVQATDGSLYGTTFGTPGNYGTVYRITTADAFSTLQTFSSDPRQSYGAQPVGGLIQAANGNLYGTTQGQGSPNPATIFQLTPDGTLTVLYAFDSSEGYGPAAALLQGADGNFYGSLYGGPGMLFQMTPSGAVYPLYIFCSGANCMDGSGPDAPLVAGIDGNFYGTTAQGGEYGLGTIFRISAGGEFATLHSFDFADGAGPNGLTLASDGNFYGVTGGGGAYGGSGTIFAATPAGSVSTLHSFSTTDGVVPAGPLAQGGDGCLYGETNQGGASGAGTVFRFAPPGLGPAISPNPGIVSGASFQSGIAANSWFTIRGKNLSPKTDVWAGAINNGSLPQSLDGVSVSVGGQPAYIAYVSPTQINALAPGVAAGSLSVTVSNMCATSAPVFTTAQVVQPAFFQWGNYAVATRPDYSPAVANGVCRGFPPSPPSRGTRLYFGEPASDRPRLPRHQEPLCHRGLSTPRQTLSWLPSGAWLQPSLALH